jgi:Concanavalin A-like lectin/glucanases superfamily
MDLVMFTASHPRRIGPLSTADAGLVSIGTSLARSFNGTSDYITNAGYTIPSGGNISFAAWVNPSAFPQIGSIFGCVNAAGYEFRVDTNGTLELLKQDIASVGTSTGTISTNTWTQVVATYDGTNLAFYINGSASGTASNTQTIGGAVGYNVGVGRPSDAEFFDGAIADAAVWSVILSDTEISNLASGQRANKIGENANFLIYWPILGQSPEPDQSGGGNNGTLNGTTVVPGPPLLQPFS